jgi:hypothetical protein
MLYNDFGFVYVITELPITIDAIGEMFDCTP